MRDLVRTSAYVGSTEIALVLVALVRNKYLAIHIGPEGFGVYGLLSSFFGLAAIFGGSWLSTGAMKYISEYNSEGKIDEVAKVFNFVYTLSFTLTTIVTFILFVFHSFIKEYFLSPNILFVYYALFAASFIGSSLKSVFTSLLQGLLQIKKIVYLRLVTTLLEFLSVIILVYFFDLTGFFISICISATFSAVLFYFSIRKIINSKIQIPKIRDAISSKLLKFGGISFFLGLINLLSAYLQRIIILSKLDIISVGFFQALNSIMNYLGILNRGSSFFFLPKMSENISVNERNKSLDEYIRFTLLTGIPGSIFTILFGKQVVQLLYHTSFLEISNFLFVFVLAQFVISIEMAYQGIIVGMAQLKIHSVATLINHISWILIPLFLIKYYGLNSIGYGLIFGSIIVILIQASYLKIKFSIGVSSKIYLILSMSITFIFISLLFKDARILTKIMILLISLSFVLFIMTKNEMIDIIAAVKRAFGFSN